MKNVKNKEIFNAKSIRSISTKQNIHSLHTGLCITKTIKIKVNIKNILKQKAKTEMKENYYYICKTNEIKTVRWRYLQTNI